MRIGVFIGEVSGARTTVDGLLAEARAAEARGFACGWVPHLPWSLDALTALALAGQVTSRIELGTAVVPTYPRHPLAMAHQALSTQAATSGRLALGIGPSHPVVIEGMYGLPYDAPARHTREYVEVLRAAFACTGHVEHHGEFFDFEPVMFNPKPVQQPQPSLLIGGDGVAAKRRAALVGDGWLPMNHTLEQLPSALAEINAKRADAGREGTTTLTVGGSIETVSDVDRYRDANVHRVLVRPFTTSRDALDGIARFGDEVIAKLDA